MLRMFIGKLRKMIIGPNLTRLAELSIDDVDKIFFSLIRKPPSQRFENESFMIENQELKIQVAILNERVKVLENILLRSNPK